VITSKQLNSLDKFYQKGKQPVKKTISPAHFLLFALSLKRGEILYSFLDKDRLLFN